MGNIDLAGQQYKLRKFVIAFTLPQLAAVMCTDMENELWSQHSVKSSQAGF